MLKVYITILYGVFIAVGGVYFSAYEGRLPGVFLAAFAKMPASASRQLGCRLKVRMTRAKANFKLTAD